jgi:single-strand DNA-binding protein
VKVSLSVATSYYSNKKQEEVTQWHNVCFYNDEFLTKKVDQKVAKGSLVYVEGELAYSKWTNDEGQQRNLTEIVIGKFGGI